MQNLTVSSAASATDCPLSNCNEAQRIVAAAEAQNIVLYVKDQKLAFMAEKGKFPDSLKQEIKQHKPAIIDYLTHRQLNADAEPQSKLISKAPGTGSLPLSYAQQGLWFIDQLNEGSSQYNVPVALELSGKLDVAALEKALDRIVQRHEILRTVYQDEDGSPVQLVLPVQSVDLAKYDLSGLSETVQSKRVHEYAQRELQKPFKLSTDLMLRGCLVCLEQERHVLLLTMHHIVSDGWSQGIFSYEFTSLYNAFCQGLPDSLPELEIQYGDFAWWQRNGVPQDKLDKQLSFWQEQLAGIPLQHSLPLNRPRPVQQEYNGETYSWHIEPGVLQQLKALAVEYKTTLFVVIQSALSALLARYSGQPDIVLGSPIAGRTNGQLSPLLGYFINTLVFRSRMESDITPRDLLLKNRDYAVNAYANQDLPFEWLVDALKQPKSLSHSPLFQIMFTLQNNQPSELALKGVEVSPLNTENSIVKYDMEWVAEENATGLQMHCNFSTAFFDTSTVMQMAQHLGAVFRGFVNQPDDNIWTLPLQGLEPKESLQDHWQHLSYGQALEAALQNRGISQQACIVEPLEIDRKICILPSDLEEQRPEEQILAALPDYLRPDDVLFWESFPCEKHNHQSATILETQFNEWHRTGLAVKRKLKAESDRSESQVLTSGSASVLQASLPLSSSVMSKLLTSSALPGGEQTLSLGNQNAGIDIPVMQLNILTALQILLHIKLPEQTWLLSANCALENETAQTAQKQKLLYLDIGSDTTLDVLRSRITSQMGDSCYLPYQWMLAHFQQVLQEYSQKVLSFGCYAIDDTTRYEGSEEFGLFYCITPKEGTLPSVELHWRLPSFLSELGSPQKFHEQFQDVLTILLGAGNPTLSDFKNGLQQGIQAKVQKAKSSFNSFKKRVA